MKIESSMKYTLFLTICILCILGCTQNVNDERKLKLASGKVESIKNFKSKFVSSRNIDVWLPNDYSSSKDYTVLYMHDGQMLFDSTKTWNGQEWGVDETMSQLLKNEEIQQTIVVGIWHTEFRHSEYFPQKPFESLPISYQDSLFTINRKNQESLLFKTNICSDNYLKFIVEELKPFIDKKYSTGIEAKKDYIAGSSMGGLISMYALCEYPEIFQGAACISTHWVGTFDTLNNPIPMKFAEYLDDKLPAIRNHQIYFDFGTKTLDALYEPYQAKIDSLMIKHNFNSENWKTLKFEGENHSEDAWKKRLKIPIKFLLGNEK